LATEEETPSSAMPETIFSGVGRIMTYYKERLATIASLEILAAIR
jgi:hypothetical protein